jgi:hypothetical protein
MSHADLIATPVDIATYGEYRYAKADGDNRPLYRICDRVTSDASSASGSSGAFVAELHRARRYPSGLGLRNGSNPNVD